MIVERYVIKEQKQLVGGFNYLDTSEVEKLHKNLFKLEFENLYANIAVGLYDAGYIKDSDVADLNLNQVILDLKHYLANKSRYKESETSFNEFKFYVNGFFGKLYNKSFNTANIIVLYMWTFYQELLEQTTNIIHIDTDSIIYKDSLPQELFKELGLKYTVSQIDYLYFIKKNTYIKSHNNEYKVYGREDKAHIDRFKGLMREERINQIFE
jgi:hypothetical protein